MILNIEVEYSKQGAAQLRAIAAALEGKQEAASGAPKVRKHKKHQYQKDCPTCHKQCRGAQGLGIHKAKAHKFTVKTI